MSFDVNLDNLYKRIGAILVVSAISLGLGRVVFSNFIIRGVADKRVAPPHEWLLAAAAAYPDSARVNFRLANSEISGTGEARVDAEAAKAESHAMRAVDLSPWDFKARRLLATAQELNGKQEEAEKSLREAVKLAPNHAELNWVYANLLLRRGKLAESMEPFRIASRPRAGLLPSAIETIWRYSGGKLDALKAFAGNDSESSLAIVSFLIEQNLVAEAVAVFNSVDKQAKINSPRGPELVAMLMRAGQYNLAKSAWSDLMAAFKPDAQTTGRLVWNGGFETDAVEKLNQFDWVIRENKYARIIIDQKFARTGSRSLRVVFSGIDTTTLSDQVQQTVVLRPGARYRLECFAKVKDLVTPEGPRLAVIGKDGVIGNSAPVAADSSDWQSLVVDFVAPSNSPSATLAIVRTPRFAYDKPTRGIIWFDDFTLVEQ